MLAVVMGRPVMRRQQRLGFVWVGRDATAKMHQRGCCRQVKATLPSPSKARQPPAATNPHHTTTRSNGVHAQIVTLLGCTQSSSSGRGERNEARRATGEEGKEGRGKEIEARGKGGHKEPPLIPPHLPHRPLTRPDPPTQIDVSPCPSTPGLRFGLLISSRVFLCLPPVGAGVGGHVCTHADTYTQITDRTKASASKSAAPRTHPGRSGAWPPPGGR